jgi:hypothetical protein
VAIVLDINISRGETGGNIVLHAAQFSWYKAGHDVYSTEEVSHQLKTIIASSAFQLKFNTLSASFNLSIKFLRLFT